MSIFVKQNSSHNRPAFFQRFWIARLVPGPLSPVPNFDGIQNFSTWPTTMAKSSRGKREKGVGKIKKIQKKNNARCSNSYLLCFSGLLCQLFMYERNNVCFHRFKILCDYCVVCFRGFVCVRFLFYLIFTAILFFFFKRTREKQWKKEALRKTREIQSKTL